MNLNSHTVPADKQQLIKEALMRTYFKDKSDDFLKSDFGLVDIEANVNQRYLRSLFHIVPWVNNATRLTGKKLIEIGCGTGSSTAAFARFVKSIIAYDIDKKSIDAAKERLAILGIENASLHLVDPEKLVSKIINDSAGKSADIILLFAVLEHMTIHERLDILKTCWDLLSEDGVLVVVETPNLLQYYDSHTSVLPFFHLLPSELCALYAHKSPRDGFNGDFNDEKDPLAIDLKLTRWGRGVSYHDFELAIGPDFERHIIANGYEPEILSWFPVNLEEEVLRFYTDRKNLSIPVALQRVVLNFILCKSSTKYRCPDAPAISIDDSHYRELYFECNKKVSETQMLLDQILSSKRWKIGNIIGMPYRAMRRFLGQRI